MIRDAPYRPAVVITDSPTGPAPTTATTSPGFTPPYWTRSQTPLGGWSRVPAAEDSGSPAPSTVRFGRLSAGRK